MRAIALGVVLLTAAGCTMRQVNETTILDYRRSDGVPEIAGKTLVNVPGWTVLGVGFVAGGALVLGVAAGIGYLQSEQAAKTGY